MNESIKTKALHTLWTACAYIYIVRDFIKENIKSLIVCLIVICALISNWQLYNQLEKMSAEAEALYTEVEELSNEIERLETRNAQLAAEYAAELAEETAAQNNVAEATPVVASTTYYSCGLSKSLQDEARAICASYNVPFNLFMGLMEQESNFNPNEVSSTNDYGICQINKVNHSWLRKELGITDFMDPVQNMKAGAFILSYYKKIYCQDEPDNVLLMTYNMGPNGAKKCFKKGIYSTDYSRSVLAKAAKYA